MSAGVPNYQQLYKMGKLPKEARGNIPMLAQLDDAEKRIKELENEIAELKGGSDNKEEEKEEVVVEEEEKKEEVVVVEDSFVEKCAVEGCDFLTLGRTDAIAKNNLRLHSKSHKVKVEE